MSRFDSQLLLQRLFTAAYGQGLNLTDLFQYNMKYQATHHSGGSRNFENWGGEGCAPVGGAYPSKIAKISGILDLKS
jgi:hypothetical protein